MEEAEIERQSYTVAVCPECRERHDVDDWGHGEIKCDCCGTTFRWCSEI